jgi:two-component system OmpR family sensor kinase
VSGLRGIGDRIGTSGRVVVAILLLLAVAFVGSGAVAVHTLRDELVGQLDTELIDEARGTVLALELFPIERFVELGEDPRASTPDTALMILDAGGEIIVARPSGDPADPDPLPALPSLEELQRRLGVPFTAPSVDGGLDYRVVAAAAGDHITVSAGELGTVDATVDALRRRLFVIGGTALAVLGVLIGAVVVASNRQTDHMVDIAARIGAGDLTARVDELPHRGPGRRLGIALNEMLRRLEAAFSAREASEERLRRFAADASHELRTPLTHIRGYSELLRSGASSEPADRDRAVARIEAEAERMTGLVEDLLLLARLDQQQAPRSDEVDLSALVTEAVADARAVEPRRPLHSRVPDRPVLVVGDESRLRQALGNLLANVRTHTPPEAPAAVSLSADDGRATVTVADHGPGFSPDAAARAFDRFYRSEDSRSRASGGSGLGLAITHAIVRAHDGTISLRSSQGEGATFTIELPVVDAAEARPPAGPAAPSTRA